MDTGARRGANCARSKILHKTGHTLAMQPAVGLSERMTGISMGTDTVDQYGILYVLVIPDVLVFDPDMSEALFPLDVLWRLTTGSFFESPLIQLVMAFLPPNNFPYMAVR